MTETDSEIPDRIDFNDAAQVNHWITQTVRQRVWRPRFFAAFVTALNDAFDRAVDVVELGPGHLAEEIRATCKIASYTAIDLSTTTQGFPRDSSVDAVLTMQAAPEVRDRSRLPKLFVHIRRMLKPEGLLLYCDHYDMADSSQAREIYLSREEQRDLLRAAGFRRVDELLILGGMALYRART